MNYNKLKYFYEVSKILNLSHASNLLFISQSSLSKAISDLEQDFGTPLFLRTNRNLILTNAGMELQRQIDPFFAKEEELYQAVRAAGQSPEKLSAQLNLGFMFFALTSGFSDLVRQFMALYPAIQIHEYRYNKRELLQRLHRRSLDGGFAIFSMDELSSDLSYKILAEYHMSIIVRGDHPFAGRASVSLSELKKEAFIMHGHSKSSNEYANAIAWCQRNGFYPNIIGEYDYVETVLLMVKNGMGIALLSDAAPIGNIQGLINVPLENAPVLYGGFFWVQNQNETAVKLFLDFFSDHAR